MPRPRPAGPTLELRRAVWCIVWWDGDSRRRISTGTPNPVRARQSLADFEASLERRPVELTLASALDTYTASRLGKVTAHDRLIQAAKVLKEGMGSLRVDQITQPRWDRYAGERLTKRRPNQTRFVPQPVSPGTLRREYNVLRAALRLAWKQKHLTHPPQIEPPRDSLPRDRYLTRDEGRALLKAAEGHVKLFVALALFTGARRGSILALTWDRVDFRQGTIDFQEPGRRITAKRRATVPMNGQLRAVMEAAHRERVSAHVVAYQGKAVPTGLRWSFAKLCSRAGLTWKPTPHHLKHSAVSWLAMAGIPQDEAADMLATDPATLRRTYRKFDPASHLRRAVAALEL